MSKSKSISFNIRGDLADLFSKVHEAAKKNPDFWSYGNMNRTDLARHILSGHVVELARQLGVMDD